MQKITAAKKIKTTATRHAARIDFPNVNLPMNQSEGGREVAHYDSSTNGSFPVRVLHKVWIIVGKSVDNFSGEGVEPENAESTVIRLPP